MSLINCPECGHEISTAAIACPSCGRPIDRRPTPATPVVMERKPESGRVPPWVIAPVILLGVVVLFGLIYLFTTGDDSDSDLAVNVNARGTRSADRTLGDADLRSDGVDRPAASDTMPQPPSTTYPTTEQSTQASRVDAPQDRKGTVVIQAKVATERGTPKAAQNTRFFLLDDQIESILNEAELEPIEGQTLTNSLALAIADQGRYGDFYRKAMSALKEHIKYTGSTDSSGKAQLGSVEPDTYYLFGVARTSEGFAMWSSMVSVISGENAVNLTPQPLTQMPSATGE